MKALVVYHTVYGNTEQIAQAIGRGIGGEMEVWVSCASAFAPQRMTGLDLLVVGSATQRFRPLPSLSAFLKSIPETDLKGIKVAAFDTRLTEEAIHKVRILSFFVGLFGYAAEPIAKSLQSQGGELVIEPQGFYVAGTEGPLVEGELERAEAWGRQLRSLV